MVERRAPTTAKVAEMILTHKGDPNAHHTPGGGADVKSGTDTSPKAVESQVDFTTVFASTPDIAISPTADKGVWVTEVNIAYFKWNNNSKNTDVTIYWIATDAGNP